MARTTQSKDTPKDEAQAAPAAPAPKPAKGRAQPSALIYLGPNIPGGVLSHGQVFRGGPPPAALDHPQAELIAPLLRPLAGLPADKLALADPGSTLSRAYAALHAAARQPAGGDK